MNGRIRTICGAVCVALPASMGACNAWRTGAAPTPGQPASSVLDIFAPPEPAQIVAWAADPYDPNKRQRGVLLLANAPYGGEPAYVEMYQQAINDGDAAVRAAAARALSMHGGPEDVLLLAPRLQDESVLVRRECARALQRLHNDVAVAPLLGRLDPYEETDADVRERAASALGQYAEGRVVQGLIAALNDRMLRVNLAAEASLKTLTGRQFGNDTATWVRWVNATPDVFEARGEYVYPVFHRDPTLAEKILPWMRAPNETPGAPVGMPDVERG